MYGGKVVRWKIESKHNCSNFLDHDFAPSKQMCMSCATCGWVTRYMAHGNAINAKSSALTFTNQTFSHKSSKSIPNFIFYGASGLHPGADNGQKKPLSLQAPSNQKNKVEKEPQHPHTNIYRPKRDKFIKAHVDYMVQQPFNYDAREYGNIHMFVLVKYGAMYYRTHFAMMVFACT